MLYYTSKFDHRTYECEIWERPDSYWKQWEREAAREESRKADAERRRKEHEVKKNKN